MNTIAIVRELADERSLMYNIILFLGADKKGTITCDM